MGSNELIILLRAKLEESGKTQAEINKSIQNIQSKIEKMMIKVEVDPKALAKIQQELKQMQDLLKMDASGLKSAEKEIENLSKKTLNLAKAQKFLNTENKITITSLANVQKGAGKTIKSYTELEDGSKRLTKIQRQITLYSGEQVETTKKIDAATNKLTGTTVKHTRNLARWNAEKAKAAQAARNLKAAIGEAEITNKRFNTSTQEGRQALRDWIYQTTNGQGNITKFSNNVKIAGKNMGTFSYTMTDSAGNTVTFSKAVDNASGAVHGLGENIKPTINRALGFVQQMGIAIQRSIQWGLAMGLLYGNLRKIRDGITFLSDLDKDLTQVSIITGKTREQTHELAKGYAELGKEMAKTVKEISHVSTELYRQGLSMQETEERMKVILQLSSAARMEVGESLQFITSAVNALQVNAETASDVVLRASQTTASSVPEVAEAFTKTASSARATGVELTELGAIISTLIEVTQESPSSLGNSLKTLLARFNQVNEETGELNEEINRVGRAFATAGVKFSDADGQIRPLYELLTDLSVVWDDLDKNTKMYISTMAAGVRQQNRFLAIMDNFSRVQEINNDLMDAGGTLLESYDIYLGSAEAAAKRAEVAFESMFMNAINSDMIVFYYDAAVAITNFVDKIGLLRFAITALSMIILLANDRFRTFFMTLSMAKIQAFIQSISHLMVRMSEATSITAGLGMAMDALRIKSVLLTAAMTIGLSVAISFLVGAMVKWIGAAERAKQAQDELMRSISQTGQEIKQIEKLIERKEELEQIQRRSQEQNEELLEIQRQIAEILPDTISAYDDQGRAISENTDEIIKNNEAKKEQMFLDLSEYIRRNEDQYNQELKNIEKYKAERERIHKLILAGESDVRQNAMGEMRFVGIKELTKEFDALNEKLKDSAQFFDDFIPAQQRFNDAVYNNTDAILLQKAAMATTEDEIAAAEQALLNLGISQDMVSYLIERYRKENFNSNKEVKKSIDFNDLYDNTLINLQQSYADVLDEIKDVDAALQEYTESGKFSKESIIQLAAEYPHLLTLLDDEEAMYKALIEIRDESINRALDGLKTMEENLESSLVVKSKAYGYDLENFANVEEAKVKITAQAITQIEQMWAGLHPDLVAGFGISMEGRKLEQQQELLGNLDSLGIVQDAIGNFHDNIGELTGGSRDRGGSGSSTTSTAEIAADRYYNLNIAIQKVNNALAENAQLMSTATEQEKIDLLLQQNDLYLQQEQNIRNLIEAKHAETSELQTLLQSFGFTFDSLTGELTNYDSQLEKINQTYRTQPEKIKKVEDALKSLTDLRFNEIPSLNMELRNIGITMDSNVKSIEDATRAMIRSILEMEKEVALMNLEVQQKEANSQINRIQGRIDKINQQIENIRASEAARTERLEREKRLGEILDLQNKLYALQNEDLDNITAQRAAQLGIEKEVAQYQEKQNKLLQLRTQLENLQNQKTIQQLKKLEDGTFEFEYVADQDAIDQTLSEIQKAEEELTDWRINNIDNLLATLTEKQASYDEWERQNDINKKIASLQRQVQYEQDKIARINDSLRKQKEDIDAHYRFMDNLTETELQRLLATTDNGWNEIYEILTQYFAQIASAYTSLQQTLSIPLPKINNPLASGSFDSSRGGSGGAYTGWMKLADGSTVYVKDGYRTDQESVRTRGLSYMDTDRDHSYADYKEWIKENTYHKGGIVGVKNDYTTVPNKSSDLINKLFNVAPNEQVIKALKGEIMIPQKNILNNGIPNIKKLIESASKQTGSSVNQIYNINKLEFPNVRSGQEIVNAIDTLDQAVKQYRNRYDFNG